MRYTHFGFGFEFLDSGKARIKNNRKKIENQPKKEQRVRPISCPTHRFKRNPKDKTKKKRIQTGKKKRNERGTEKVPSYACAPRWLFVHPHRFELADGTNDTFKRSTMGMSVCVPVSNRVWMAESVRMCVTVRG